MWKWTDASQQLGVLQHEKKFKYTRKVGNRYYYDDQKPTAKITGAVNKEFATALSAFTKSQALADHYGMLRENMDSEVNKNADGSYSITLRDKSTGKTVGKETMSKEDILSGLNYSSISESRKNKKTASPEELDGLAALDQLNKTKVSNLMKNKKR